MAKALDAPISFRMFISSLRFFDRNRHPSRFLRHAHARVFLRELPKTLHARWLRHEIQSEISGFSDGKDNLPELRVPIIATTAARSPMQENPSTMYIQSESIWPEDCATWIHLIDFPANSRLNSRSWSNMQRQWKIRQCRRDAEFFEHIIQSSQNSLTFASTAKMMFTKTGGLSDFKRWAASEQLDKIL
jgi:hypothetical protein